MKKNSTEEPKMPSVSEPEVAYVRLSPNHQPIKHSQSRTSRSGRMSVDEFCNILHEYVDDYYEGIQG